MAIRRRSTQVTAPPVAAAMPCAARHRAFVARRLRGVTVAAVPGVSRTLRRLASHVLERLTTLTRSCTRIVERRLTPVVFAPPALARASGAGPEVHHHRESRAIVTRLIDRRTHSIERTRTSSAIERRIGTVLRAVDDERGAIRIAPPARVEARHRYPPLARIPVQVVATPKPATERREALPPFPSPSERRAVTRFGSAIGTAEPLTLPQNELARVTEHVIGELDRRVRSFRERMGKI